MSDQQTPFSNEYIKGASQTSATAPNLSFFTEQEESPPPIPLVTGGASDFSNTVVTIEQSKYGTGKPRRIIIRGKISSD